MAIRTLAIGVLVLIGLGFGEAQSPSLSAAVKARPFPEYGKWWPIGNSFATFMSDAIVPEWSAAGDGDRAVVSGYVSEYLKTVYQRDARPSLVQDFIEKKFSPPLQSGEFDALSYGFFRTAFESIARRRVRRDQEIDSNSPHEGHCDIGDRSRNDVIARSTSVCRPAGAIQEEGEGARR